MSDVKIRNLEPYIVEAYKARAKVAGRSLEAELRDTLSLHLSQTRTSLLDKLDTLRAALPIAPTGTPKVNETLEEIRRAMSGQTF